MEIEHSGHLHPVPGEKERTELSCDVTKTLCPSKAERKAVDLRICLYIPERRS
jgi:hypothetical protein